MLTVETTPDHVEKLAPHERPMAVAADAGALAAILDSIEG
jgi:hypothetical protein